MNLKPLSHRRRAMALTAAIAATLVLSGCTRWIIHKDITVNGECCFTVKIKQTKLNIMSQDWFYFEPDTDLGEMHITNPSGGTKIITDSNDIETWVDLLRPPSARYFDDPYYDSNLIYYDQAYDSSTNLPGTTAPPPVVDGGD